MQSFPFPKSIIKNVIFKNILRKFEPKNFEKLRTAQPEPKFTGSYKKKRVLNFQCWKFDFFSSSVIFFVNEKRGFYCFKILEDARILYHGNCTSIWTFFNVSKQFSINFQILSVKITVLENIFSTVLKGMTFFSKITFLTFVNYFEFMHSLLETFFI